jgi:DNA polymerase-3 subunit delta'
MARDAHPDCHVVHRQLIKFHSDPVIRDRKGSELGKPVIDQFVIEPASRKGCAQQRKIFVIEEAELMNPAGQNCLLKTLEEPPPETYIILLTTRLDALLPTTRSRCQLIRFNSLPAAFIAESLPVLCPDLDAQSAQFLAAHEAGSLGKAVQLARDGFHACNSEIVGALLKLRRADALQLAGLIDKRAGEQAKKLKERLPDSSDTDVHRRAIIGLLDLVASFFRDVLRLSCGVEQGVCNRGLPAALQGRLGGWDSDRAAQAVTEVAAAQRDITAYANNVLTLEGLAIRLARLQEGAAL